MPLIIFVDDHKDDAHLFQKAINEICNQCVVTLAEGSSEFFDLLEKVTPEFIFLDVVMPHEGGISCLKKIRAQAKYDHIPIIMYSVSPVHMEECFKEHADFYIKKPNTYEEIVACIEKVLTYSEPRFKTTGREHFLIN